MAVFKVKTKRRVLVVKKTLIVIMVIVLIFSAFVGGYFFNDLIKNNKVTEASNTLDIKSITIDDECFTNVYLYKYTNATLNIPEGWALKDPSNATYFKKFSEKGYFFSNSKLELYKKEGVPMGSFFDLENHPTVIELNSDNGAFMDSHYELVTITVAEEVEVYKISLVEKENTYIVTYYTCTDYTDYLYTPIKLTKEELIPSCLQKHIKEIPKEKVSVTYE